MGAPVKVWTIVWASAKPQRLPERAIDGLYVRNKDDAFRRLANRLFDGAMTQARAAAEREGPLADRLYQIIAAKLDLTVKLWQDTPHAAELLDAGARLSGDIGEQFGAAIRDLRT